VRLSTAIYAVKYQPMSSSKFNRQSQKGLGLDLIQQQQEELVGFKFHRASLQET
jgi:hypothetical protein